MKWNVLFFDTYGTLDLRVSPLASGFSKRLERGPPADGSGLSSLDTTINKFFKLVEGGGFGFIPAQGPFKNEVFYRLTAKRGRGLEFPVFLLAHID